MQRSYLEPLGRPGLRVIFVGTEPGSQSLESGCYYANPNNSFYKDLAETGWTPRRLVPSEYRELLTYGIGLDDVYLDPRGLRKRIERLQPIAVCFNSKAALARMVAPEDLLDVWAGEAAGNVVRFSGVRVVWALPDSSGTAVKYRPRRLELLAELKSVLLSNSPGEV